MPRVDLSSCRIGMIDPFLGRMTYKASESGFSYFSIVILAYVSHYRYL